MRKPTVLKEKTTFFAAKALALMMMAAATLAVCQSDASLGSQTALKVVSPLDVRNIAGDFLTFWDTTQGKPTSERVLIFKRDVAPEFPGFYGIARFDGKMTEAMRDATIARSIDGFGAIREAYALKLDRFDKDLVRNTEVFRGAFPDFYPTGPVWVVHSLGEMDGGTREVDGRSLLIFGLDGMVDFHGKDVHDESAFFHHELFHMYHAVRFNGCDKIWCSLWREGLATYVASKLDGHASEAELSLTTPDDMAEATRQQLMPSLLALRDVLTTKDAAIYSDLFGYGGSPRSALPQRRGYYLGFLVARKLGQTYDLHTLANMSAAEAQPLVVEAVKPSDRRGQPPEMMYFRHGECPRYRDRDESIYPKV